MGNTIHSEMVVSADEQGKCTSYFPDGKKKDGCSLESVKARSVLPRSDLFS